MKASFISVLATLAAFQTVLALPAAEANAKREALEEKLPNGIYAEHVNDDGTSTWEFLGPVNTTAAEPAVEKRQGSYGVHCHNQFVNSNHRWAATNGLADYCGNGRFFNSKRISIFFEGAVAYACNYLGNSGTSCGRQQVLDNLIDVADQCGGSTAGWWSNGQGTTSYGYTANGVGHC